LRKGPLAEAASARERDVAEDRDAVPSRIREKGKDIDPKKLSRAVSFCGKYSKQKKIREVLQHAARVGI